MLLIPCRYCGFRNASEFRYSGELGGRPDPARARPQQWRSYLYQRSNAAEWIRERWFHAAGCRRFLVVERHARTNEIRDPEAEQL